MCGSGVRPRSGKDVVCVHKCVCRLTHCRKGVNHSRRGPSSLSCATLGSSGQDQPGAGADCRGAHSGTPDGMRGTGRVSQYGAGDGAGAARLIPYPVYVYGVWEDRNPAVMARGPDWRWCVCGVGIMSPGSLTEAGDATWPLRYVALLCSK